MTQYLPATTSGADLPGMIRFALEEYNRAPRHRRHDLHRWLETLGVYKLPEVCYQQMYSITLVVGTNTERRKAEVQEKIQKVLTDWLEEHHPDKALSALTDFSSKEARDIHPQLQWGIYLYLLPKAATAKGIWEQLEEMDRPSLTEIARQYRGYFGGKEEERRELPGKPKGLPDPRRTYPREEEEGL